MKALTKYIEELPSTFNKIKPSLIQILNSKEDPNISLLQLQSILYSCEFQKSFFMSPEILIFLKNRETSIFYMQIFMILSRSFYCSELSQIAEENKLYGIIIQELHFRVSEKDSKLGTLSIFESLDYTIKMRCYLEFLEFLNFITCIELEFSAEKILICLIYNESNDLSLQSVFFKSFTKGLRFMQLCNSYYRSIKICGEVIFENACELSSGFFKLFKFLLLKVNKNCSILLENKKFSCVTSGEIFGLEYLVILFYNSQKSLYKKSKNLIYSLLTCFSHQSISEMGNIINNSVSILIKSCDKCKITHKKRLISLVHSLIHKSRPNTKYGNLIKVLAIFEEDSKMIEFQTPIQVLQIRNKLASAFRLKTENTLFEIDDKIFGPQKNLKKIELTSDNVLSIKITENIFEAEINTLSQSLVEQKEFFWTLFSESAEEKYNLTCFDIVKNITKESLRESNIEDFFYGKNFISVPLSDQLEFIFKVSCASQSKIWLKKIKSAGYHNLIFENLIEFFEKNPNFIIFNEMVELIINLIDIEDFDYEIYYQVCKSSFFWIMKNPSKLPSSDNDSFFISAITKIMNKLKPAYFKLFINFLIENADLIVSYLIQVSDISSLLFPLKKIGDEDPQLLKLILSKFEELYSGLDLNEFMLTVTLISSLDYKPYTILNKLFEILVDQPGENENFYSDILSNIFSNYPDFEMPLPGFKKFLITFLIPNQSDKNLGLPLLKSTKVREIGFNIVLSQCRLDSKKVSILLEVLNSLLLNKSWRKSNLSHWKINLNSQSSCCEHKGLYNPGTICYSNSFIQQLFHMPTFTDPLLSLKTKLKSCLSSLQKVLFKLKFSSQSSVSSNGLIKSCVGPKGLYEQMDTDEFILKLFEKCSKSELGYQFDEIVQKNFIGIQNLEIKCKRCKRVCNKTQDFKSIGLQVFKKEKNTLLNSLRKMTEGEMMTGVDALFCNTCNRKEDSEMRIKFIELPLYLIFVVKRFEYDLNFMVKLKINEVFEFTEQVNLMEFVECGYSEYCRENFEYQLKGVINHMGTADLGHYISCVRTSNNEWFKFNDSVVSKTTLTEVLNNSVGKSDYGLLTASAYIIIYRKVEKLPEISKFSLESNQNQFFHKIIEKNKEIQLTEILFTEGFLNSIIKFIAFQDIQIFIIKYCLSCFFRMEITSVEKIKFYREFYNNLNIKTILYLIEILTSYQGIQEFIICNPHSEHKTFLITLIQKHIHSIEKSFILLTFKRLMKVFLDTSFFYYKFNIYLNQLFFMVINNLEENWKINYIENIHLGLLTNNFIKFEFEVETFENEFIWTKQHNLVEEIKNFNQNNSICTCMFFKFMVENFNNFSFKIIEMMKNPGFTMNAIISLRSNLGIIALTQLYSKIYKDYLQGALKYLGVVIECYKKMFDEEKLKLISLFFKYYPARNELFFHFIEFYLDVFLSSHIKESRVFIKYTIKSLKKLKYSEISNFLSIKTNEKLKNAVQQFLSQLEHGDCMRRISHDFFNGVENKDFDQDDEIDPNFLVQSKILWIAHYGVLMKCEVYDNFCNRILSLGKMGFGFRLIDYVHFDIIKFIE